MLHVVVQPNFVDLAFDDRYKFIQQRMVISPILEFFSAAFAIMIDIHLIEYVVLTMRDEQWSQGFSFRRCHSLDQWRDILFHLSSRERTISVPVKQKKQCRRLVFLSAFEEDCE